MTEHYMALWLLSVCLTGIIVFACFLAIALKREAQFAIRCWRVRQDLKRIGLHLEPQWPKWLRAERGRR